jgi:broad specificity phosphatase PhoE
MSVIFVRHAESAANVGAPIQQDWLTPLTMKGILQAHALIPVLPPVDLVAVSPFTRAQQTSLIARPGVGVTWRVEEFTYLSLERKLDERDMRSAEYWERNDPDYRDGLDAESFNMFISRVRECLKTLEGRKAIVFSHSGFMKAVYWIVSTGAHGGMKTFRMFKHCVDLPNTAMVKLRWGGARWYIGAPETGHLTDDIK